MTRELGKALQSDERYIGMRIAQQRCDEDEALQAMMEALNEKRAAINAEIQKDERDEDALRNLNQDFRLLYAQIMENPRMLAYNQAKTGFDALIRQVTAIIGLCADGEDPDTCDYEAVCAGDCSSCAGCH